MTFKQKLAFLMLFVAAVFIDPTLAWAQAVDTTVHVGWGDLVGQLGVDFLPWAGLALFGIVVGIIGKAFPIVGAILTTQRTAQVEQLLERALGYAASQLQGALKGKELNVNVKTELVAHALQYALDHGSKALLDFVGGVSALSEKVEARILTSPAVQSAQAPMASATVATSSVSQQPGSTT